MSVLAGSLPVVSFGDAASAVIATLSLNPSWLEFQSPAGAWLTGSRRRLASLVSLGVADPQDLDDDQIAAVLAESNGYFRGPNWYRTWFHWLESLLTRSGAGSYLNGTACHLDLVQWATKPAQGQLPPPVWNHLVAEDSSFLHAQLRGSPIRVALLNGASTAQWVRRAGLVSGFDEDIITYSTSSGNNRLRLFRADAGGMLFLGWNKPLASAIAADGRSQLADWIAAQLQVGISAAAGNQDTYTPAKGHLMSADPGLANGFVPAKQQWTAQLRWSRSCRAGSPRPVS
jgi:hypothetical protein